MFTRSFSSGAIGLGVRFAATVLIPLSLLTACGGSGSKGVDKQKDTTQGLASIKKELVKGKADINAALASLNALSGAKDLPATYKKFVDQYGAIEGQQKKIKSRGEDLKKRSAEYYANWEKESANISDPAIRERAMARKGKAKESYDKIKVESEEAKAAYEPFMASLKDIKTLLGVELTPASVASAADLVAKANKDGAEVNAHIDAIVGEIDNVMGEMNPTPAK